ncbi:hypothetical protein R3P38DRAFT_2730455 [Favolaschia claudopus]|uniref:N-acetyltransferase domain-containing protein n=1 Tax=Favolaschia claudopus TaxID=2862362 RepID=A0AAW0A5Y1_9AGAR
MSISVRQLTQPTDDETRDATRVLHEAFERKYFLPALGGDQSLVEPFLLAHVKATVIGGQLYVAELPGTGIVGVALWFGPGQKFLSGNEQRDAGWNQTMNVLDTACQNWWDNFLSLADTVPERLYGPGQQQASYHLQTFGVLPQHQKKGYGTALMSAVEEKAKLTSSDVVLETMGEAAVPIYKKLGFEVLGPEVIKTPRGEANAYCFRKRTGK